MDDWRHTPCQATMRDTQQLKEKGNGDNQTCSKCVPYMFVLLCFVRSMGWCQVKGEHTNSPESYSPQEGMRCDILCVRVAWCDCVIVCRLRV